MLNRQKQYDILTNAAKYYPRYVTVNTTHDSEKKSRETEANLFYLREHGLVNFKSDYMMDGSVVYGGILITAKGLDFLADDGGLSSILGVVTVKLHADTIRDLLINKVASAPGEETTKTHLINKLKSMPAEALGKVFEAGLDHGLDMIPDLLGWLGKALDL